MQNESSPSAKASELSGQAKEFGRQLKDQASDFAATTADTLKTQANQVAGEAREMARDTGEKIKATLADQKIAGADYLGAIGQSMRRASHEFDGQIPQAGDYIRKAADQIDVVTSAIRNRDISQLVGDVQDFARKQPAAFFGAAVLAGFAVARFFKSAPEPQPRSYPTPADTFTAGM